MFFFKFQKLLYSLFSILLNAMVPEKLVTIVFSLTLF